MPLGLEKTRQLSTGEKSAPFFFKHIKSKRQAETKKSYEDDGRTRRADGSLFDYDSAADQKSAIKEQPPVFPDDLLNTEDEEEKFARERRLKAWWGNRPERSRSDFGVKVTRPSTQERRALDETREARLLESVRVLEQMMQQRTFKEGDQEMLMSAFKAIDSDGSGRIDYDEFWAALAPITNNLRDSDRKELFMKVDADCSGSVGMIDFLNFFLVTDYEQLQRPATGRSSAQTGGRRTGKKRGAGDARPTPSYWQEGLVAAQGHKDVMVGIHQTLNKEQYATVSRDGAMHVYTSQLKLLRKIRVSDPVVKVGPNTLSTPGYIISTARMPVTGTVGVASMRRAIRFYDPLALTDSGALVLSLPKAPRPITCINAGALGHGKELLLRGDEEGHVELYSLHPGWTRVEGQAAGTFDARRMAPFLSTSSYLAHPGHWVTHAAYIPDLGPAVVSSGTDSRLCLLDFEADKIKWSLDASKARGVMMQEPAHTKGIRTWDWSDQYNFFATAGLEREVRLWSAFVNKPIGTLEGVKHGSARIVCNEAEYQILSLGLDKTVSIWDIRTQRLVEVIQEDRGLLPEDSFTAMLVDNDNKQLIVGSGKPQMHTARRPAGLREVQRPTVAVAVCDAHMLVATADEGNEVRMWRAGSGRAIFAFSGVPPESTAVVTTLAFDAEQLRLLVAANDGFVRLFNHGNGMVLKTFRLEGTPDVAALLSVHLRGDRHLFAATESAEVYAFLDTQDRTSDQAVEYERRNTSAHRLEVSAMCALPPECVVTASSDGRVIVWHGVFPKLVMEDPRQEEKPFMVQGMQALCALAASPPAGRAGSPSRAAQELRLVLSGGADGCLHVWDAAAGAHLFRRRVFRTSPSSFGVAQLCADRSGRFVACGDATGMLKMYDASVLAARPAPEALVKVCAWRAHERALISVEMLHTTSEHLLGGSAVITATVSQMRIWTLEGSLIGTFGPDAWDLSHPRCDRRPRPGAPGPVRERARVRAAAATEAGGAGRSFGQLLEPLADVQEEAVADGTGGAAGAEGLGGGEEERGGEEEEAAEVSEAEGVAGDDASSADGEDAAPHASLETLSRLFAPDAVGGENFRAGLEEPLVPSQEPIPEELAAPAAPAAARDYFTPQEDLLLPVLGRPPRQLVPPRAPRPAPVPCRPGGAQREALQAFPRDYVRAKRGPSSLYGRLAVSDVASTDGFRGRQRLLAPSPSPSEARASPRASKHKLRFAHSIEGLRNTPAELRPGLAADGAWRAPATPEIYGLTLGRRRAGAAAAALAFPARSHTSML